jgi:hypothetical protein
MKQRHVHLYALAAAFAVGLAACSDGGSSDPTGSAKASAAAMAASTSTSQSATVGTAVSATPTVTVKDANGVAVAGVTVTFAVTAGAGSVLNPTATTNALGVANAGSWTLGPTAGTNTVEARIGTLAPVVFTATGTPVEPPYAITVRYIATASARQQLAVSRAVERWQSVITRDLLSIPVSAPAGSCFETQPKLNEVVDDIVIFVEFVDIDGAGNILGQAGPCYVRSDNSLPVVGHLKLDVGDLQMMERSNTIDDVVLHEIGHVLGIGTMWSTRGLLSGAGTDDPRFTGSSALTAYRGLGGLDPWVAVENSGSEGTRDGHWRESIFGNELMTGYINSSSNPMSAITVASLTDLGYGTNPGAATAFTLTRTSGSLERGIDLHKSEKRVSPKFKIDRQGRKTKIEP